MTEVRGNHPYHFRSGEWAQLVGRCEVNGRPCVDVVFPDGAVDTWIENEPGNPLEYR